MFSMKNKNLVYLFLILAGAGVILFLFTYSPKNNDKLIIADIRVEVEGIIKKKVAVRDGLMTHVKVARRNKPDTLIFLGERIDSVDINENIMKYRNSPFFYISSHVGKPKKLRYVSIPKSILEDKSFPEAWKDSCRNGWRNILVD
ncbi:hypothetical protein IW16_14935 [Chryseobacterium vrystaatense]|uniref:Uncharacterized protein n=2 Tax=Chryseobacterium vrystaatense TaxID=307480 RepID=A0ABR4UKD7_9FLAO|nr:hypothetical protein IW16_14935 [Chryseobacterium vrystaatense]